MPLFLKRLSVRLAGWLLSMNYSTADRGELASLRTALHDAQVSAAELRRANQALQVKLSVQRVRGLHV